MSVLRGLTVRSPHSTEITKVSNSSSSRYFPTYKVDHREFSSNICSNWRTHLNRGLSNFGTFLALAQVFSERNRHWQTDRLTDRKDYRRPPPDSSRTKINTDYRRPRLRIKVTSRGRTRSKITVIPLDLLQITIVPATLFMKLRFFVFVKWLKYRILSKFTQITISPPKNCQIRNTVISCTSSDKIISLN